MNRHRLIRATSPRLTPAADRVLLVVAVVLMLAGAGMLVADVLSPGITIPLITVGVTLVAIESVAKRAERRDKVAPARQDVRSHALRRP